MIKTMPGERNLVYREEDVRLSRSQFESRIVAPQRKLTSKKFHKHFDAEAKAFMDYLGLP